jgi:hypothetical protein
MKYLGLLKRIVRANKKLALRLRKKIGLSAKIRTAAELTQFLLLAKRHLKQA